MSTYDPNKSYSWKPTDKFEISGQDFGMLLQAVKTVLSTEEAAKVALFQQIGRALDASLISAVESGAIKETPLEPEPATK